MKARNTIYTTLAVCTAVAVWSVTVAPAQAQLVGLWRFDDATNVGLDSSPAGNNLTAYGNATMQVPGGKYGGALSLGGSDDYLGIATDNGGDSPGVPPGIPIGSSAYTIAAYIQPDVGVASNAGIIGWGNYGSMNQVNAFRLNTTDGLHNYWWNNDLGADDVIPGTDQFTDGTWRHVAVTYDNTAGNDHKIYLDGMEVLARDSNNALNVAAENFRIGATNLLLEDWLGNLDDVAVFNIALTPQQIQTIAGGDFSEFGVAGAQVPEPASIAIWMMIGLTGFVFTYFRMRRRQ